MQIAVSSTVVVIAEFYHMVQQCNTADNTADPGRDSSPAYLNSFLRWLAVTPKSYIKQLYLVEFNAILTKVRL